MSDKNDYSWGKERVTDTHKIGNIVTIPLDSDIDIETKNTLVDKEMQTDIAIDEFIAFQYDRAKWLKIDDLIYACSLVLRKAEANYNLHDILG